MKTKTWLCVIAFILCFGLLGCANQRGNVGGTETAGIETTVNETEAGRQVEFSVDYGMYSQNADELMLAQELCVYKGANDSSTYSYSVVSTEGSVVTYSLTVPYNTDQIYISAPVLERVETISNGISVVIEDGDIVSNTYDNGLYLDGISVEPEEDTGTYCARYQWSSSSDYYPGTGEADSGSFSSHMIIVYSNTYSNIPGNVYGSFDVSSKIDLNTNDEAEAQELANNITLNSGSVLRFMIMDEIVISSEDIEVTVLR